MGLLLLQQLSLDCAAGPWSCYFDSLGDYNEHAVYVRLKTDGGWKASGLTTLADNAGTDWLKAVGADFPALYTVVVTVDGVEHEVRTSQP